MASGIVRRAMVYLGLTDDDEFEDYSSYEEPQQLQPPRRIYAEPPEASAVQGAVSVRPIARDVAKEPASGVTVSPRSVVRPIQTTQAAKVHVVAPSRFGDAQEIGDRFKNSQPVVVDLKDSDGELNRRMIDFCSGVTYALGGGMEKVADKVFLLTPSNVEVSADEKRKLAERGLYQA